MSTITPARTLVVAGLITSEDRRILITQRRADQSLPLKWEFPGGKVEPGEAPTAAVARELEEEIGVRVQVGRIWEVLYHMYDQFELVMLVYQCQLDPGGQIQCREVRDFAWCHPAELRDFDILPADQPLIERLIAEGPPAFATGL